MLGKLRAVKLSFGGEIGGVFGGVLGGVFWGLWRVQMDRELLQDSDGVNDSFWDGLGVEFEAR